MTSSVCEGRPEAVFVRAKPTDEIVGSFPHSTLADVYAALAYYHDNRMVIDEHIRDDDTMAARLKAKASTTFAIRQ